MSRPIPRWIPTVVTAGRGLCGPLIAWLLLAHLAHWPAFWIFAFAAITDLFDGWLARLAGSSPQLGAWLDPAADKLLFASTWLGLLAIGWAPLWLVAPLLLRDALVAAGWLLAKRRDLKLPAPVLGQFRTSYEGTALGILLFHGPFNGTHWPSVGVAIGACALALAIASALESPIRYLLRRSPTSPQVSEASSPTRPAVRSA